MVAKRYSPLFLSLALLSLALSGCAVGTAPGGGTLSGSFDVPLGYRQAYRNALAQTEMCLLGNGGYRIEGGLEEGRRAGLVSVVPTLFGSGEVARVELSAIDDTHTRVKVGMWGESIWNAAAMRAMRDAVTFSAPSCMSFMPAPKEDTNPDAWFGK